MNTSSQSAPAGELRRLGTHHMRRWIIVIAVLVIALLISLFPTWNFAERIQLPYPSNPLWNEHIEAIDSPLTRALRAAGFKFDTGRGAEADPDGVCFGDFGTDEYWVIMYQKANNEIDAYAWIIKMNWIGHLQAHARFNQLTTFLRRHLAS